jgi:mannose-6-phosphate isomerase-like protein (cupin superfamily)
MEMNSEMKRYKLTDMIGGWFIGNFEPSIYPSNDFEVCLKRYKKGDKEPAHFQHTATEYTLVVSGQIRLGEKFFGENEIIEIPPLEIADFESITDSVVVAIKTPSIPSDKEIA